MQFFQIINAALFVPPLSAIKNQLALLGTKKHGYENEKTWQSFTQAKHQPCTASYRARSENTGLILTPCIFCHIHKRHYSSGLTPPMFSKLHKSKTPYFLAPTVIGYKKAIGKTAQKPRHPTPRKVLHFRKCLSTVGQIIFKA
jgi:hypothetical protein